MIIKITNGATWELIDGFNRLNYREISPGENIGVREDVTDLTLNRDGLGSESLEEPTTCEIWLYRDSEPVRQVLAYRPIYVLNDAGKTVEKI